MRAAHPASSRRRCRARTLMSHTGQGDMTGSASLWGATYFLSLFAALLALPTSWFLLRRYRRSILRLMNQRSSGDEETEGLGPAPDYPRPSASPDSDVIEVGMRRNVIVVVIVALVSAFAFAALFLVWTEVGISVWRLSTFGILYSWPAVIGIWIVTGGDDDGSLPPWPSTSCRCPSP
jgi:hypothetical protein